MSGGATRRRRVTIFGVLSVVALATGASGAARAASDDPWSKGRAWITVRAGYAKSLAIGAGDGNFGAGFGYLRFRNSKWSFGANGEVDLLGRFGNAKEIESPWTVEVARHYRWPTAARPYIGLGGGVYYNVVSGTGKDRAGLVPGYFLSGGLNARVSDHGLFGFDVRASMVKLDKQDNPVFGGDATLGRHQKRAPHWSAKVTYGWAF